MKKEKPPIYLQIWFIIALFVIGFLGIMATFYSLILWPVAIVLIVFRARWSTKAKADANNAFMTEQNESLQKKVEELQSLLTPEQQELQSLSAEIDSKQTELQALIESKQTEIQRLDARANELSEKITASSDKLKQLSAQVIETDETVLLQSFGLYEPKYDFATSTLYKDRLDKIRSRQKEMIKSGAATTGNTDWTVNGSKAQGKKMVKDMQKLLLRAFNTECDELIQKVKFNNIDSVEKRIRTSREAISKLGTIMSVQIAPGYLDLKIQELYLAYEYAIKKQEEKEELKRIRAEQREQAKLEKEIEAARQKLEKEQAHCENELRRMLKQDTSSMTPEEKAAFDAKKAELESQLGEIEKGIADVDYRAANQRAGYVYVISNIGAFGEDIYKIGMTRRLNPMDRVDELGDASVPFNFDVHAMIFSENAPALEAALHSAFEDRKLNMVNTRREFFHVTLDEIKEVVKQNFDKTVEFTDAAPAEQYRESLLIKKQQA
ncbi:MAG: DUF4041 domain-containing protein [Eubacteriales bacterium]|nr:DUF4041 domain-containing protein [Eubacteriales bacterium]